MYNKKGSNLSETLLLGNYGKNHQDKITLLNNFSENYYIYVFLELHSTTQTLTTRTHTHPFEHTYTNHTPISTSEGLSTDGSRDSRSHH
jgi:hypothetical protein